jgi:hypothetical protein
VKLGDLVIVLVDRAGSGNVNCPTLLLHKPTLMGYLLARLVQQTMQ